VAGSTQQMAVTAPGHRQCDAIDCMLLLLAQAAPPAALGSRARGRMPLQADCTSERRTCGRQAGRDTISLKSAASGLADGNQMQCQPC
jgi:hypothetical protein